MNFNFIKRRSIKQFALSSLMLCLLVAPLSSVNASNINEQDQINLNDINERSGLITPLDSLTYKIGETSTHIYFSGKVTISYNAKGGSQGIHIGVYQVGAGPVSVESGFFAGKGSVTYNLHKYHYIVVEGDTGVSGTYTVTY
ncbi:hypothetical protein ABE099_20325 [Paenibacillus turicensis]|uniref:hypothetical protein n=1 Tax=Paenibacillus turicensis TaxID=160487 RepID=UPI003D2E7642